MAFAHERRRHTCMSGPASCETARLFERANSESTSMFITGYGMAGNNGLDMWMAVN